MIRGLFMISASPSSLVPRGMRSHTGRCLALALMASVLAVGSASAQTMQSDSARRDTTAYRLPPVRVTAAPAKQADAASAVVISPQAIRTAPATNAWDIVRQT